MNALASARHQSRWESAADEHQVALAAFMDTGGRMDDAAWQRPWRAGKWTPAEITEHLSLAYEALLTEIREGRPMGLKMAPWRLRVARWVILPHILFHRSLPLRAPAPRETRPREARAPRAEALAALRHLGEEFERELDSARRAGSPGITHPYFGRVEPVKALRFVAIHMEHHRRQVERARAG